MNPFNAHGVAFALKTSTAAIAAMLLALWFNLPNPGWAAVTVFVTSQQQAGAAGVVIGRSGYRALGTLMGAAATLFLIPAFASAAKEPSTTFSANPSFGRRSAQEELHPGKPFPSKFVYGAGFSVSYQVDLFGQIQRSIAAAEADAGSATAARDAARVTVVAETTRAYLELCSAGREIVVAHDQVDLQSRSTELTRRLATHGRGTPVNVERSSVQEEQVRASIPTLEAQRRVAMYRLAALTGRAPQELPKALVDCDQEPRLAKPIPIGDGASLLRRRPDIRRAEFDLLSASDRIGVVTADLYPKVSLGASIASVGVDQYAFRNDSFKFSLGPFISWEFPDRTRVKARIRGAEADREAALARFDGVVLTALKETESALEVHARDHERRVILQSARTQAQNAARDTQRQFEAGRIGYLPVLDALRTLAQVEQNLAAAESRVAADQVNLFLALGGGWGNVHVDGDESALHEFGTSRLAYVHIDVNGHALSAGYAALLDGGTRLRLSQGRSDEVSMFDLARSPQP